MKKWWMSEMTGELQETLVDVVKCVVTNMFRFRFIDLTWHRLEVDEE